MHPGWVSQVHSHMQSSSNSLDGEDWRSLRAANNIDLPSSLQIPDRETTSPVTENTSSQPRRRCRTEFADTDNIGINSNPVDLAVDAIEEVETSDEEMEPIPKYGSLNASGFFSESRRRSNASNGRIVDSEEGEKMRSRLRYYFMNPLEKWETRRQFPYKLVIQLLKIFLVTIQLILFGSYRYASVNYIYDNKIAFSHLFIKDWDSGREITTYPPNTGPLAVYKKKDFYDYVDHVVNAYSDVTNTSIGPYYYHKDKNGVPFPIHVNVLEYVVADIDSGNDSFIFDTTTRTKTIDIPRVEDQFSSQEFFQQNNFSINFVTLLQFGITLNLHTIRFRDLGPLKSPDCFSFDIIISFLNMDHDGQILISLDSSPKKFLCKGQTNFSVNQIEKIGRSLMNYSVIIVCTISFVLCCRAIYRAQLLKVEAVTFFLKYFEKELTVSERLNFLNGWYILIIINDVLIVLGSVVKEQVENRELQTEAWTFTSTCLGIGNLLVWFGVLRYLGFFRTYNVLILTLKRASPNVLRFLICAILIYAGFTFCGWLILGPYHMKFSSLSSTSECLFALINGDDMFATFASMSSKSIFLWWFCRLYLYTFISLFIYVVLSLFIALIMDAYETIKLYYTEGFPRSSLDEFIIGPNDLNTNNSQAGSYSPTHGDVIGIGSANIHPCHHFHHHHYHPNSTSGRKISAGGMLDTLLESICGCSPPKSDSTNNREVPSRQVNNRNEAENQPLLCV